MPLPFLEHLVQEMIDAVKEYFGKDKGFQVRFDTTIPSGAQTCHFTIWRAEDSEKEEWTHFTEMLDEKALEIAQHVKNDKE